MNARLMKPFTEEEVRQSMFDMHPTKALGWDGLPAIFSKSIGILLVL